MPASGRAATRVASACRLPDVSRLAFFVRRTCHWPLCVSGLHPDRGILGAMLKGFVDCVCRGLVGGLGARAKSAALACAWLLCAVGLVHSGCRGGSAWTAALTADESGATSGGDTPSLPDTNGGLAPPTLDPNATALGLGGAVNNGNVTSGGTITFRNIGAEGWWARRFNAAAGASVCDVEDDTIDLGAAGGNVSCCRGKHTTTSVNLSPFDEQMTFILRGPMHIKQMAVYQPSTEADMWARASAWTQSAAAADNIKFTGPNDSNAFTGLIGDSCQWYVMQSSPYACGPASDPYCSGSGPSVSYNGWGGSKLVVFLASYLPSTDALLAGLSCSSTTPAPNAPWIGFSASELMRDGWGKYFPCHCYDNNNSTVGAGCGEINVFETVAQSEGAMYGNEQIISTGLRSFQVGSFGGNVCGYGVCDASTFSASADLLDACTRQVASAGATLTYGEANSACPVWRRPFDDRYFYILLDTTDRAIQVGLIHPQNIPAAAAALLPNLPGSLARSTIDAMLNMSLPAQ